LMLNKADLRFFEVVMYNSVFLRKLPNAPHRDSGLCEQVPNGGDRQPVNWPFNARGWN